MSADITGLLREAAAGGDDALEDLYRETYRELHRIARGQRRRVVGASDDLNTTALVHEAFLKFQRAGDVEFSDREHFFAVAARAMRQLLVDRARKAIREKRGGGATHVSTAELLEKGLEPGMDVTPDQILDLHRALQELHSDEQLRRLVECRVFAGMSENEIAGVLHVNVRTVRRHWAKARAFLTLRLLPEDDTRAHPSD